MDDGFVIRIEDITTALEALCVQVRHQPLPGPGAATLPFGGRLGDTGILQSQPLVCEGVIE